MRTSHILTSDSIEQSCNDARSMVSGDEKTDSRVRDCILWDTAAPTWTDFQRSGKDKYRRPSICRLLENCGDVSGQAILDIGCGEGSVARLFRSHRAKLTAVDLSPKMIEIACSIGGSEDYTIDYRVCNAANMPSIRTGSQDIVLLYFSLFNIAEADRAIVEANRVCCLGGLVVITLYYPIRFRDSYRPVVWQDESRGRSVLRGAPANYLIRWNLACCWEPFYTMFYHRSLCWYLGLLRRTFFTTVKVSLWSVAGEQRNWPTIHGAQEDIVVDIVARKRWE